MVQNLLSLTAIVLNLMPAVFAGTCWSRFEEDSQRCTQVSEIGVSREECCSSGRQNTGWTENEEFAGGKLFYFEFIAGGAPSCIACHENCDNVECFGEDRKCRVKDGRARCVCSPDCSHHDERFRGPICGDDQNTYRNYCTLLKTNCRKNANVKVDYLGKCRKSCDSVHCLNGKNCLEDQNGLPHCVNCAATCLDNSSDRDNQTLCGADLKTYKSGCDFKIATCLNGKSIGLAYLGECDDTKTCSTIDCSYGTTVKKCLINPKTNRPQCVTCEESFECAQDNVVSPVCGSDGQSYSSWCAMQRTACRTGIVINTEHYGPCQPGDIGTLVISGGDSRLTAEDMNDMFYYQEV